MLEAVFRNERADWKAALANVKGVYLIADKSNGKKYIGSAYGDAGIWVRWACYIGTGHGWNDELITLIDHEGIKYAGEHFRFSVLEVMVKSTPDDVVLAREAHWKRALLKPASMDTTGTRLSSEYLLHLLQSHKVFELIIKLSVYPSSPTGCPRAPSPDPTQHPGTDA